MRNPRVGDLEIEGGHAHVSDPWRTLSPDPDSPAAQERRTQRQRDRVLLKEKRQLEHDRAALLAVRKSLAAEQATLNSAHRRLKRERLGLVVLNRIGLGLVWSPLSGVLARNEVAARGSLTKMEQNLSDLASCKAELEQIEFALENNRIALQDVRN